MFTKNHIVLSYLILSMSLVACGGDATPASTAAATTSPAAAPEATAVPAATDAPAPTAAPAAVKPSGDPKEALLAAMRKQITSGPYRVKTSITADGSTMQLNGEVVPPDQMHMIMDSSNHATEMIFKGKDGWMKTSDKWETSPMSGGDMMKQVIQSVDEFAPMISNVQYVGEESLDGKPANVYTYHMELGADKGGVKSDAKVWIDSATGLVTRSESDGDVNGKKSKTVQVIEYDANIKIEAPVK